MEMVLYSLNQMVMIQGALPRPRALKFDELTPAESAVMAAWDLCAGWAYMELALHIEDKWKQTIRGSCDLEDTYGASLDGICVVLFTQITTMKYTAGPMQMHQLKWRKSNKSSLLLAREFWTHSFFHIFLTPYLPSLISSPPQLIT